MSHNYDLTRFTRVVFKFSASDNNWKKSPDSQEVMLPLCWKQEK